MVAVDFHWTTSVLHYNPPTLSIHKTQWSMQVKLFSPLLMINGISNIFLPLITNLIKPFLFSGLLKKFAQSLPPSIFWSALFKGTLREISSSLGVSSVPLLMLYTKYWTLAFWTLITWFWWVFFATTLAKTFCQSRQLFSAAIRSRAIL